MYLASGNYFFSNFFYILFLFPSSSFFFIDLDFFLMRLEILGRKEAEGIKHLDEDAADAAASILLLRKRDISIRSKFLLVDGA